MGDLWLSLAHTLAPLALSVTLCHSLALSGSLWSLILLTRPLVSSQRRCHADALYSSLALVSFFLKKNKICWLYFSGGNTRIGRKFKILVRFQLCRIARQVWLPAGTSCPTIVSAYHLLSTLSFNFLWTNTKVGALLFRPIVSRSRGLPFNIL